MKTYTLKDPKYLPPKDKADEEKYGSSYWSYTHDSDIPVMFNLMSGDVGDGSVVTAETIEVKESKKGQEYHRLKKVKVEGQGEITPHRMTDSETIMSKLDEILAILRIDSSIAKGTATGLSGYEKAKEKRNQIVQEELPPISAYKEDEVADFTLGDEPIDLSEIPF